MPPPPPSTRTFGALLKRFRAGAGLTQGALAERVNYSAVYIGMLERGERLPSPVTIDLLAGALHLAPVERAALAAAARRTGNARAGPYPDTRSQPPLVNRVAELAALDRHLAGEGPPVVVLAGEPGIGKTRLLYETIAHARSDGWTVLYGGCQRRSPREPYSPLLEALDHYARSLSPGALRLSLQDCSWLARVLPELALAGVVETPAPLPPERERRLVFGAIARFLSNIAGSPARLPGTLLVLDDLQWAGPDALDILLALAHGAGPASLRLVCAYRDTESQPGDALGIALGRLAQAGLATSYTVPPLSQADAQRMFDGLTPDPAMLQPGRRTRLLKRAAGVPFFIISCAHDVTGAADEQSEVPWNLAHSVRQRIAALPHLAREILDAAAVIGREVPRDLVMALTARPRHEVLGALEIACRRRLLEEHGDDTVHFAHDVIREVVEADLSAVRRRTLHRRVAEALENLARRPSADHLAYHYGQSDRPDRALVYLERAGDQAHARSAHGAAADHFHLLMDRLGASGRDVDAARVGEKLGAVLSALGRHDDAVATLDMAAVAYRGWGDINGFGRVVAQIGRVYGRRGTPGEGIARIEQSLPTLTHASATRGLAAVYAALAHLYWLSGRYEEQFVVATRAAQAARAGGDAAALAAAEGRRGTALFGQGRFDDALPILEDAARLAEAAGDLDSLWRALNNISTIYFTRGEFERCRPIDEQALGVARLQHDPVSIARILSNRGEGTLYRGDWAQARVDFDEALALVTAVGDTEATVYPLLDCAFLRLLEGHWDDMASLDEAARLAERTGDLQALRWLGTMRAEMDIRRGYPERALTRCTRLLDRPGLEETDVTYMLPVLAWAHLEAGDLDAATAVAARAIARARAHDHRVVLVDALRIAALVSCYSGGEQSAAVSLLDEGLALAAAMPYPFAQARLLHVYSEVESMIALDGERDPARERLEAAAALYERLGARADAAQAGQDSVTLPYRRLLLAHGIVITHGQWARIEPLIAPARRRGRPRADDRRAIAAILYVQRTGCGWSNLPPALGDDATAHRRYRQWRADGTWSRISAIVTIGREATTPRAAYLPDDRSPAARRP